MVRESCWKKAVVAGCCLIGFLPMKTVLAYEYIVSGWPVGNPSRSEVSAGVGMDTGAYSGASESIGLDARFRSWMESVGIALKTTAIKGLSIFFK